MRKLTSLVKEHLSAAPAERRNFWDAAADRVYQLHVEGVADPISSLGSRSPVLRKGITNRIMGKYGLNLAVPK